MPSHVATWPLARPCRGGRLGHLGGEDAFLGREAASFGGALHERRPAAVDRRDVGDRPELAGQGNALAEVADRAGPGHGTIGDTADVDTRLGEESHDVGRRAGTPFGQIRKTRAGSGFTSRRPAR